MKAQTLGRRAARIEARATAVVQMRRENAQTLGVVRGIMQQLPLGRGFVGRVKWLLTGN